MFVPDFSKFTENENEIFYLVIKKLVCHNWNNLNKNQTSLTPCFVEEKKKNQTS